MPRKIAIFFASFFSKIPHFIKAKRNTARARTARPVEISKVILESACIGIVQNPSIKYLAFSIVFCGAV